MQLPCTPFSRTALPRIICLSPMSPILILVSGLPGAGKSTLAEGLGRALGCPVFAKDWLEAALWRSGVRREQGSGWAGYELLTALAES